MGPGLLFLFIATYFAFKSSPFFGNSQSSIPNDEAAFDLFIICAIYSGDRSYVIGAPAPPLVLIGLVLFRYPEDPKPCVLDETKVLRVSCA